MPEPTAADGLTVDEHRVRLISDTILYPEAVDFRRTHLADNTVKSSQLHGMLQYTTDWSTLLKFTNHQKERNWQGHNEFYGEFYHQLSSWIKILNERRIVEFGLVSDQLSKKQQSAVRSAYSTRLAAEFIRHLIAEIVFSQSSGPGTGEGDR